MAVLEISRKNIDMGAKKSILSAISGCKLPKKETVKSDLVIIGEGEAKKGDFSKLKKKSSWQIKQDLFDWTNRDFALYISKCYKQKYDSYLDASLVGMTTYLPRVKQALLDSIGFCDNIVTKDYIEFFFEKWAEHFRINSEKDRFSIQTMRFKEPIIDFAEEYDYKARVQHYTNPSEQKTSESLQAPLKITNDKMLEAYSVGIENFVLEYGVIATVNWLIMSKGEESKEAAKKVIVAASRLNSQGAIEKVKYITKKLSPYPSWFVAKNYKVIFNALNKRIDAKINDEIQFNSQEANWEIFRR